MQLTTPRHTRKPCPGCGQPGYRSTDQVCHRCAAILAGAKTRAESLEQTHPALRAYRMPDWPQRFSVPWYHPHAPTDLMATILSTLLALAERPEWADQAFPAPDSEDPHLVPLATHGQGWMSLANIGRWRVTPMTPETAAAVRTLHQALHAALTHAYTEGVTYGRNCLAQLASGDCTLTDFERRTTRSR